MTKLSIKKWFNRHPDYLKEWRAKHPDYFKEYRAKMKAGTIIKRVGKKYPEKIIPLGEERYLDRSGYVLLKDEKGKFVLEHRVIMEKFLERKLLKEEHVHHVNGKRDDNRIKNLEIVDARLHLTAKHRIYM